MPPEPGRLVVNPLLGRARRARGCATPGDDRLETRAYAVKRYLCRLGHAQRSARFATSIAQLVAGLAPVMGWGPVPRDAAGRARFVRAHRRSVQRWLDDLQAAGLVAHEPERDGDGMWWRTQIVLLAAPVPSTLELRGAHKRARGWRARERARRRRARVAPSLGGIRGRSAVPSRSRRARVAIDRQAGLHETRRRARVEAQSADAAARRGVCRDLTHPFGAPPTSAPQLVTSRRSRSPATSRAEGSPAWCAAPTVTEPETVAVETGARGGAASARAELVAPAARTAGTEETGLLSREDFDALVARRLAACEQAAVVRAALLAPQVAARVDEVRVWPRGRRCPLGRLREAWTAQRYGIAKVLDSGTAAAGAVGAGDAALAGSAIELYEAHAQQRPPGWPESGPGALCALAGLRGADRFAGDVARLLILAKAMRAVALEHDAAQLARARAEARTAPPPSRWSFWRRARPRVETAEMRRWRVRDAVLLLGGNPAAWPNATLALAHLPIEPGADEVRLLDADRCEELDGTGARAARYRAELARGRWQLPHDQASRVARHPTPEEGTPR